MLCRDKEGTSKTRLTVGRATYRKGRPTHKHPSSNFSASIKGCIRLKTLLPVDLLGLGPAASFSRMPSFIHESRHGICLQINSYVLQTLLFITLPETQIKPKRSVSMAIMVLSQPRMHGLRAHWDLGNDEAITDHQVFSKVLLAAHTGWHVIRSLRSAMFT